LDKIINKFIIVDIETPGSFRPKDGIREVAAIAVENYEIIDQLHLAVIIDEKEYALGYGRGLEAIESNDDLKNKFRSFIETYNFPLVAHNASFDRSFLNHWGWIDDNYEIFCSLQTIRCCVPGLESYSMKNLICKFCNKESQSHTAYQDVIDLYEIIKSIKPSNWVILSSKKNSSYKTERKVIDRDEEKKRYEYAKNNVTYDIFRGKIIVFTGDAGYDRTKLTEQCIRFGARVTRSISKNTDLIVIGDKPGQTKLNKATELGIEKINSYDFIKYFANEVERIQKERSNDNE